MKTKFPPNAVRYLKTLTKEAQKPQYKKFEFWATIILSIVAMLQTYYISQQKQRIDGFEDLIKTIDNTNRLTLKLVGNVDSQLKLISKLDNENSTVNRPYFSNELYTEYNNENRSINIQSDFKNIGNRSAIKISIETTLNIEGQKAKKFMYKYDEIPQGEMNGYSQDLIFMDHLISKNIKIIIRVSYTDIGNDKTNSQTFTYNGKITEGTLDFIKPKPFKRSE